MGVSQQELIQTAIIALIIFILLGLKRRDFLLYCFDPSHARVAGLAEITALWLAHITRAHHCEYDASRWGYFGCSDANCAWHHRTNLTNRFDKMLVIAIISAVTASLLGVLLSYHFDASTGACIILLQAAFFLLALIYSKIKVRLNF